MECNFCGVSDKKTRLLDGVSRKGVVKICVDCSKKEDIPIARRPTTRQLKESEKKQFKYLPGQGIYSNRKTPVSDETSLKDLIDKRYRKGLTNISNHEKKPRPDLVDNFHWVIMRARRRRKMSRRQLAKEISESEAAIKMAEHGKLPEDDYRLVNKLESFLGIRILKDKKRSELAKRKEEPARVLKFDTHATKNITISDLKKLKELKERSVLSEEGFESIEESEDEEDYIEIENQEDDELSDDEVRDIVFRK